jgi:hypothetical protein
MALKIDKKIKSTMFLFLCVFGGLVGYDEGSRWDNFWNGRKYEQPNENSLRLCGLDFYKMIGKEDFEEMKRWGKEEIIWSFWKKTWRRLFCFLWTFSEIIVEVLEGNEREVVRVRFVDFCLEGSTKTIHYAMY